MIKISSELAAKLLAAKSAEEASELVKATGQVLTRRDVVHLWAEIRKSKEQDGRELSADELESVSGGADRDWETDGCAASCEAGSWCWSNDKCIQWEVTYDNMPSRTCEYCNGAMEYIGGVGNTDTYRCKKCGRTREIYEPDYDVT